MNSIFTSSKTSEWATPDWLYKQLDAEFHFQLDAACTDENCKCVDGLKYIDEFHNALVGPSWHQYTEINGTKITSIFCNPPYNNLHQWIQRGDEASQHGCTVVFLLPTTKIDQKWFHNIVLKYASEIRFIEGRVKFGGAKSAAPFPSMVVIFRPTQIQLNKTIRKETK